MNCPNCGAKNDGDARFCAECGRPLDDVVAETAKVEQIFDETSEDMTMISSSSAVAVEAKTLAVGQAKVVAATEEVDNVETGDSDDSPSEPESSPPPPTPSSGSAGGDGQNGDGMDAGGDGSGGNNRTLIIVGVVILVLLLLCCCCSVLVGVAIGSDPGMVEDLIGGITMPPLYLSFGLI